MAHATYTLDRDGTAIQTDPLTRTLHIGRENPIRISTGHRLQHHNGKCSRPHGHNYKITVEITGLIQSDSGWVADKGNVTSVIDEWDHRFVFEAGDPLIEAFEETDADANDAVIVVNEPPTAEVMGALLEQQLFEVLPATVSDITVSIAETGELCAAGE